MIRRAVLALLLLALAACGGADRPGAARVLVMGDSVMAWNGWTGRAVADALEDRLSRPVADLSVAGARLLTGEIAAQYPGGDRDWVVLNGGANDFSGSCGCDGCGGVLDRLIGADGQGGALGQLIGRIRADGARVVYVGYYRAPPRRAFFRGCEDEFDALDARVMRLAARDPGVVFVSAKTVFDPSDPSLYALDRVHPSAAGSSRMAGLAARAIAAGR